MSVVNQVADLMGVTSTARVVPRRLLKYVVKSTGLDPAIVATVLDIEDGIMVAQGTAEGRLYRTIEDSEDRVLDEDAIVRYAEARGVSAAAVDAVIAAEVQYVNTVAPDRITFRRKPRGAEFGRPGG